jgi:signal transduction histidine kinase
MKASKKPLEARTADTDLSPPMSSPRPSQAILDSLPVPVWAVDAHTLEMVYVNARALEALGKPSRDWHAGPDWARRVFGPGAEALLALLRQVRSDGVARSVEHAGAAAGESEGAPPRWFETTAQVSHAEGGQSQVLSAVTIDVTERRRAAQQLEVSTARLFSEAQDAMRSREDLLAIVSHDLRNPLGVVLTSSALLLRSPLPPDKGDRARRQVEAIQRAGNRMNRLIRDLLDFSSIQGGQLSITPRPHDAGSVVAEVLASLEPPQKSLRLVNQMPAEPIEVTCDRDRLIQTLSNILGNAVKFTPEDGTVAVQARREGAMVRFSVSDTGPGMSAEALQNIFDRYWQAQRKNRDGIGLGLSIVKGIVEAHGGKVWADSRIGAGTTVHFTLPAASPPQE